jgi:hypothetical protein
MTGGRVPHIRHKQHPWWLSVIATRPWIVAFDLACLAATQQEQAVQPASIEVKQTRFTGN